MTSSSDLEQIESRIVSLVKDFAFLHADDSVASSCRPIADMVAKQAVTKALQYAYIGRKQRKRQFRSLWIARINAGARQFGLSYSRMINGLGKAGITIDRKVLADLAVHDIAAFGALAGRAKAALGGAGQSHAAK